MNSASGVIKLRHVCNLKFAFHIKIVSFSLQIDFNLNKVVTCTSNTQKTTHENSVLIFIWMDKFHFRISISGILSRAWRLEAYLGLLEAYLGASKRRRVFSFVREN